MRKVKVVSFSLDPEVVDHLRRAAEAQHISTSKLVNEVFRYLIEKGGVEHGSAEESA